MKSILAVYEDGVFKPLEPVDMPEHSRVRVEQEGEEEKLKKLTQPGVYEVLSLRYDTGDTNASSRVDEHQP